ncbi:MAG: hypothetical protein HC915_15230 [Anaerolineae bacterium]|nr:hypothetical protein [Anaerolineae bacterium]
MPPPSALVGSGRGLHVYWRITPTTDFATAGRALAGLVAHLGGDRTTVAQALRLPGSHNPKPSVDRPCRLLWLAEERRYTLDDFARWSVAPP